MPVSGYPNLFRLTWSGLLGPGDDEIFSYTRHAIGDPFSDIGTVADSAATDVTDFLAESTTGSVSFTTIGQAFPTSTKWTMLKVYSVDEATGVLADDPAVRTLTDHGLGTGVPNLTHQDAFCVTLQTSERNRQSRNRFYLPTMIAAVLADSGHVRPTFVDDIQTQLKLANTAHLAEDPSWQYCVYSPSLHLASLAQRWYSGDVMDTIRRRRNKLVEARHALSF